VLGNIASESESTTVRTVLGQLSLVVRNYLNPQRRTSGLVDVADALWGLLAAASPASDTQFQLLKAFSSLASTPEHISTLQGLRAGAITLEGLSIDQDLQWELLAGLALAGAATRDDVDHELTLAKCSGLQASKTPGGTWGSCSSW